MKLSFIFVALFCTLAFSQTEKLPAWVERALSFQRQASLSSPINYISAPCAHNAYNNPWNLPAKAIEYSKLRIFDGKVVLQNQDYNMTDLLNYGVRHLQLDAHYIPEYNQTLLCHGAAEAVDLCPIVEAITGQTCKEAIGFEDLGEHTGCTKDAVTWRDGLMIVKNFVAKHTDEFFLIDIENKVDSSNVTTLVGPLEELFSQHALTKTELTNWRNAHSSPSGWPTLQEIVTLGKNVIITSDVAVSSELVIDLNPSISYPDNQGKYFDSNTCKSTTKSSTDTSYSFFQESAVMVVFDILGISANSSGYEEVGKIDRTVSHQLSACAYAMCRDRVSPSTMDYYVWSWEVGKADVSCVENLCAAYGKDGWTHMSCSSSLAYACQKDDDPFVWTLGTPGPFPTSSSCSAGHHFSYPKSPKENRALSIVANGANVWLNISLPYLPNSTVCTEDYQTPSSTNSLSPYGVFLLSLATIFAFFTFM